MHGWSNSSKVIIPASLRGRVIELANEDHSGMTVMKRRLRAKVWWPKIDLQVERYMKKCHGCTIVSATSVTEQMNSKDLPTLP